MGLFIKVKCLSNKMKTRRMYITNYRTAFLFVGFVFNGLDTKRQGGRERRNEIRM